MMRRVFLFGLMLLLWLPVVRTVGAANADYPAVYTITDLGAGLSGPFYSRANAINDAGQVVGTMANNYAERGFIYQDGQFRDIPAVSALTAINSRGDATGYELNGRPYTRAISYRDGQASIILGVADSSIGDSINDAGTIVGQNSSGGFIFDGTVLRDLAPLPGMTTILPYAINNREQIVGNSGNFVDGRSRFYPFLADKSGTHPLPPLPTGVSGTAFAINDVGTIALGVTIGVPDHAYLYRQGQYIDLDPGATVSSRALALNNAEQVVGVRDERAFLYSDGLLYDLNTLIAPDSGWRLIQANDINNRGQIVGYGEFQGAIRAFLLTPRFVDVGPATPYRDALLHLANRGIVRGYGDGRLGPGDLVARAQAAAFIARSVGWDGENWTDQNFPDQGSVDDDLWRNVRALAHYGVAKGYDDGTYNPAGPVLHQQVALFVARAMIVKGYWVEQPDTAPYPNLPNATERDRADRRAVATYVKYAGPIPDRPVGQPWADWGTPATRGWFAQVLWQALQTTPAASTAP